MKIDLTVPMQLSVPEQLEYIRKAEEVGIDGVGLADHMEHGRDVYSVLAMAAMQTSSIDLYPCVTNPVTRHPWVLANIAHSFDEVAPGRFKLVIGAGDTAVAHVGKRPAKVAEMRDAVVSIQKLLRGETVQFGDKLDEQIIGIEGVAPVVSVAAGGPRMTELAGEVGDEALLLTGFDDRILSMVQRQLETGAARSGRSLEGFKLTHYTLVRIEDDADAAAEFGRSRLLGWLKQGFFRASLQELGVTPEELDNPERIPASTLAALSNSFFLIGPIESIAERLLAMSRGGKLDRVACVVSGTAGPEASLDAFVRTVLPALK